MTDDSEVMDDVNLPGSGATNEQQPDTFTSDPVIDIDPAPAANGHSTSNKEGYANGEANGNGNGSPARAPPRSLDSMEMLSLPKKQSGLFGACSNLVNSIVGAGIVGIPYAFRQAGFIAGLVLLGLVAFLTDRSLRVIVNLATYHPKLKNRNVLTFEALASYPFGKVGKAFILVNMVSSRGSLALGYYWADCQCLTGSSPILILPIVAVHHGLRRNGRISHHHQGYGPDHPWRERWCL